MKHALVVMAVLCASAAFAGERYLGAIVSATGADTTNDSTATPFYVPSDAKITVWCNASAIVVTDSRSAVTATTGLPVSANEKFPTSTGTQVRVVSATAANGGAVVRIFGTAAVSCYVFDRRGNE